MKRRIQAIVMAAIMLTALLVMPSTYAKYTLTKSYDIGVTSKTFFKNTTNGDSKEWTLEYPGRYLIIAKGGDGANGAEHYLGIKSYEYEGGIGGTVMGIYTVGQTPVTLKACPGTAGKRCVYGGDYGEGGKNSGAPLYNGGRGNIVTDNLTGYLSSDTSSGGGGAGTVVYIDGTVVMEAGGGGAAPSWNKAWQGMSTECGKYGGNGGSVNASGKDVYASGGNGDGKTGSVFLVGSYDTSGKGATGSKVGAGGVSVTYTLVFSVRGKTAGSGSGNSGGEGAQYGGGGGGGHFGGGGGSGSSLSYSAGGGGGGSSFASSRLSAPNTGSISIDTIMGVANIPKQYASGTGTDTNAGDGDGYVIVMYLGE